MAAVLKPNPTRPHTATQMLDDCCNSTEVQQRLAYRELFRPHIWPPTFEAAMARKPFRVAICRVAINRSRVAFCDAATVPSTLPRGAPVPPTPPARQAAQPAPNTRPIFGTNPQARLSQWPNKLAADRKRLAANDKDDA